MQRRERKLLKKQRNQFSTKKRKVERQKVEKRMRIFSIEKRQKGQGLKKRRVRVIQVKVTIMKKDKGFEKKESEGMCK